MKEESTEAVEKVCLECGKPLGAGRSDRKYCDDFCRTAYNNSRRSNAAGEPSVAFQPDPLKEHVEGDRTAINRVHSILMDNRSKLMKMFEVHGYQLSLQEFNRYGVNLKYFTSCYPHEELAKVFRMCFDYGYAIDGNHVWLIQNTGEILYN